MNGHERYIYTMNEFTHIKALCIGPGAEYLLFVCVIIYLSMHIFRY